MHADQGAGVIAASRERVATKGGEFHLYVRQPAQPNGHCVIVLQEIFGVNAAVKALADQFALAGYLAVAPDLFWRFGAGLEFEYSREDTLKAMALVRGYSSADGVSDTLATAGHVRSLAGFHGKVATVGLCLGGLLAYLCAATGETDAAVSFYATDIGKHLDQLPKINCPLSIHYGGADRFIPMDSVSAVRTAVEGQRKGSVYTYPGAEHGFYTRGTHADRALAHQRVLDFLETHLTP